MISGDRLAEDNPIEVNLAQDFLCKAGSEISLDCQYFPDQIRLVDQAQDSRGEAVPVLNTKAEEKALVNAQEERVLAVFPAFSPSRSSCLASAGGLLDPVFPRSKGSSRPGLDQSTISGLG